MGEGFEKSEIFADIITESSNSYVVRIPEELGGHIEFRCALPSLCYFCALARARPRPQKPRNRNRAFSRAADAAFSPSHCSAVGECDYGLAVFVLVPIIIASAGRGRVHPHPPTSDS